MIDITMLGTGGGMPIPDRHLSSMIISYRGRKILIDAGEGTQVAMRRFRTGFKSIDIICITHFHGDHIFGLPGLLSTMGNSDRTDSITIIGPIGLKKIMDGLLISLEYIPFDIKFIENSNGNINFNISETILGLKTNDSKENDDMIISTLELEHSSPCLGYSFYIPRSPKFYPEKAMELDIPKNIWSRLQMGEVVAKDGKEYSPGMVLGGKRKGVKLSFITDTRPIENIVNFIKKSDLFLCEGTYGDDEDLEKAIKNSHMTFREAAVLAHEGEVKRLLLTHFSTAMNNPEEYKPNATEEFQNTIIVYDGYKTNLTYED